MRNAGAASRTAWRSSTRCAGDGAAEPSSAASMTERSSRGGSGAIAGEQTRSPAGILGGRRNGRVRKGFKTLVGEHGASGFLGGAQGNPAESAVGCSSRQTRDERGRVAKTRRRLWHLRIWAVQKFGRLACWTRAVQNALIPSFLAKESFY